MCRNMLGVKFQTLYVYLIVYRETVGVIKMKLLNCSTYFLYLNKAECSLPSTQQPSIDPYNFPNESSPLYYISLKVYFNIIRPSKLKSPEQSLSFRF